MLKECDEKAAAEIHENNVKRVIRAIEFFRQTGTKISEHNAMERQKKAAYDFRYFVLMDERQRLYKAIDRRVDLMLENGLVEEVKKLMDMGCRRDSVAMQGLGYKEIISYLEGECTLDEAVCVIKRDTRRFAKRQLTWFRRERDVIWIEKDKFEYDDEKMLHYMLGAINNEYGNREHI